MLTAFITGVAGFGQKGSIAWQGTCELISSDLDPPISRVPAALIQVRPAVEAKKLTGGRPRIAKPAIEFVVVKSPKYDAPKWATLTALQDRSRGLTNASYSVREFDAPPDIAARIDASLSTESQQ